MYYPEAAVHTVGFVHQAVAVHIAPAAGCKAVVHQVADYPMDVAHQAAEVDYPTVAVPSVAFDHIVSAHLESEV